MKKTTIWRIIAAIVITPILLFALHIVLLHESKWYRQQGQMETWLRRGQDFREEYPDSLRTENLPKSPALIDSTKK